MTRRKLLAVMTSLGCLWSAAANASTMVFFDGSQVATPVASGATSDTIRSEGYLFTYTRDKLFTGGGSVPIGRMVRVPWPQGMEAQAVTAGPSPGKAKITIQRTDGDIFDLPAFTAKLLANTAGAGGQFEVVPFLNGEEFFANPVTFNASGVTGNTFSYDTSPNPLGSTALLTGFDKYTIDLYVDFALVGLTLNINLQNGDFNRDHQVTPTDIPAMLTGLTDLNVYKITHNYLSDNDLLSIGDMDSDGRVTNADIQPLLDILIAGGAVITVPEPGTATLVAWGLLCCLARALSRGPLAKANREW